RSRRWTARLACGRADRPGEAMRLGLGEQLVLAGAVLVQPDRLFRPALVDDLAALDEDRPVAELGHVREVVGHEDDRLGAVDELLDPQLAPRAEGLVAGPQDLVEEEDVGGARRGDRKAEAGAHARGI